VSPSVDGAPTNRESTRPSSVNRVVGAPLTSNSRSSSRGQSGPYTASKRRSPGGSSPPLDDVGGPSGPAPAPEDPADIVGGEPGPVFGDPDDDSGGRGSTGPSRQGRTDRTDGDAGASVEVGAPADSGGPFAGDPVTAAERAADELRAGDPVDAVLDATPVDEVANQDTPERVDELTTRGGFFSEREEAELRSDAEAFRETFSSEVREPAADAAARFGPAESATARRRSVGAGLGAVGAIANVPANLQRAETATEVATNADPSDVDDVAEAAGVLGAQAAVNTGRTAVEKPAALAGETLLGLGGGAVAGRAAGSLGRSAIDRQRTFGAEEVDPAELTSEEVLDGQEQFPGAADEDLYRSDPAAAVREQADDNTPDAIASDLDELGATGDADLKKALDQPIEDPEGGDAFGVPDDVADEYEAPGSFVGPELSPNFLRVGERGSGGLSLTPGLPDLGNRPTGAVIRTDVENAEADTLEGFGDELEDRAGDDVAITKPADEANPGEVEAVVPPGARFPDADGGSADFFTEIEGRRVPIRTFGRTDGDADTPAATPDGDTDPSGFGRDRDGAGTRVDDVTERVDPRPDDGSLPLSDVPGSDFAGGGSPSSAPDSSRPEDSSGGFFSGGPFSGGSPGGGSSGGSGFGFGGSGGCGSDSRSNRWPYNLPDETDCNSTTARR